MTEEADHVGVVIEAGAREVAQEVDQATDDLAQEADEQRAETAADDELGTLSRAFNRMTIDLKDVTASKAELEQEIAELKQRIATLEAIVTDKSYQLKDQINQLSRSS